MKNISSKNTQDTGWFKSAVKIRFSAQVGDNVIIRDSHSKKRTTIEAFCPNGIILKDKGFIPFNAGLFYGCGYIGKPIYTLKKNWHYLPARICEKVRLKMPGNIRIKVFGF